MITDIGHTAFAAHDLERTLAFYAQLGINKSFRLHHADGSLMYGLFTCRRRSLRRGIPRRPAARPGAHWQLYASVLSRRRSYTPRSSSYAPQA